MASGLELKLAHKVKELIDNVGRPRAAAIFQQHSHSLTKVKPCSDCAFLSSHTTDCKRTTFC